MGATREEEDTYEDCSEEPPQSEQTSYPLTEKTKKEVQSTAGATGGKDPSNQKSGHPLQSEQTPSNAVGSARKKLSAVSQISTGNT